MKNIIKALLKSQSEFKEIKFNKEIKYGNRKFGYADLGAVISAVTPSLNANKIFFTQTLQDETLKTTLYHESGETIESSYPIPRSTNPQDLGKWITYIKRYQLASILGVVAEDDSDGDVKDKVGADAYDKKAKTVSERTLDATKFLNSATDYKQLTENIESACAQLGLTPLFNETFNKLKPTNIKAK